MSSYFNIKTEPDHVLEEYWKNFKQFIIKIKQSTPIHLLEDLKLNEWILTLNILKTKQQYVNIEKQIEKYIAITGWVIVKQCKYYHASLFLTHMKQWSHVPSVCKDDYRTDKNNYFKHLSDDSLKLYLQLLLYLTNKKVDIHKSEKYSKLFSQLNIPDYQNKSETKLCIVSNIKKIVEVFSVLVDEEREGGIDIISKYIDIAPLFKEYYNIEISSRTSARKIFRTLKQQITSED